jgi:precorrin-6B methylase 2
VASALILETLAGDNSVESVGGSYYESRARQGAVLAAYEVRVARALLQERPFEAIYEVGSGVSTLSICLAMNGARAIGIERDSTRANLGRAILGGLAQAHPHLPARCEIRRDAAPMALRGVDGSDSAIVFTNIAGSILAAELEEIIVLAATFRTIVVDLSRFWEARDKPAQVTLLDRFMHAGWGSPAPVSSPIDTYWMFRKPSVLDPDID